MRAPRGFTSNVWRDSQHGRFHVEDSGGDGRPVVLIHGEDLKQVSVPTLVLHGDADGIVPFEGSGKRTHAAIAGSELVLLEGAPRH